MRESMIIYRSFYDAIKELEPTHQAEVWRAVFEYGLNKHEVELQGLPSTIFTLIKPQLDANIRRYDNGTKGGRPKKQNETKTKPKQNLNETKTKPNVNDNVNGNDNVNQNVKRFIKPTIEQIKKEYPNLDALRFHNYYESNGWMVGRNKMKDWKAAARNWLSKEKPLSLNKPPKATLDD